MHSQPSPSKHPTSTSSPRNPISLRLYKVFGASFDDDGTKEALRTLSEFYAPASTSTLPNGNTAGDDSEDSDHEIDDDDEVLSGIPNYFPHSSVPGDAVPGERAARARKSLRRDVENKLTESSHKFLKAFGEVDQVGSFHMLTPSAGCLICVYVYSNWISCRNILPQ
jgi:conserved oligomeric Golgi complex subunit 6